MKKVLVNDSQVTPDTLEVGQMFQHSDGTVYLTAVSNGPNESNAFQLINLDGGDVYHLDCDKLEDVFYGNRKNFTRVYSVTLIDE